MKNLIKLCLFFLTLILSHSLFAQTATFEDFSSGTINRTKFPQIESTIKLDTTAQNIELTARAKAFTKERPRTRLRLVDSSATTIQADVSIKSRTLGNQDTQTVFVSVAGTYYNSQFSNTTVQTGDIFVRLAFGDKGNGLEAWYEFFEAQDDDNNFDLVQLTTLNTGPLSLDTPYTASIEYDGNNGFIFTFNGTSSGPVSGPTRVGTPRFQQRRMDAGLRFGYKNSTAEPNDSGPDDGSIAGIVGTIDNVTSENGLIDAFSTATLDPSIWIEREFSRSVENGKLKLEAKSINNNRSTTILEITNQDINFLSAKTTLLSSSLQNAANSHIRVGVAGYWYNDTFTSSDTGDGRTGDIFGGIQLRRDTNTGDVYISYSLDRATDSSASSFEPSLFFGTVTSLGIQFDEEHELSIEKDGSTMIFRVDGEIVSSHPIDTPINPVKGGLSKFVRAQTRNAPGEAHALFDDIITDYVPAALVLTAKNESNEDVALPSQIIVNEGEVVSLKANVTNAANVAAYIWEQTSGPEVIPLAGKANTANKIVGSESVFAFTVPTGADNQTLAFKVTIVDLSGVESEQAFNMSVDDTAASTLATATVSPPPLASGGGSSGAFNPFFIIMILIVYLGARFNYRKKQTN